MEFREQVSRARKGDDSAFQMLMQENREMLYKIAYTYVGDRDLSLEIFSETVYKAYINIRKLKKEEFFKTWLTRILINSCLDHLRRRKRLVLFNEQMHLQIQTEGHLQETAMDLRNAIDKLNDKHKNIIILKYYQSLTLAEIAEVLDLPLGTVKTHLHKALKILRLDLEEETIYD